MAHVVVCDLPSCQRTALLENHPGWITVEVDTIASRFSDAPGAWELCSWEHVRIWAEHFAPR